MISKSSWASETAAVLRKELLSEARGRHGFYTSILFALMAVTAIGFAAARATPTPHVAAGLLWVAILFAAITGLGRAFIAEEEQGTGDLLRLWARPGPVFCGKLLYNLGFILLITGVVCGLFLLFLEISVTNYALLAVSLLAGAFALAGGLSVCGSLVARAGSRGALLGVISIPPLLIVILLGAAATGMAFGGVGQVQWSAVAGLAGIGVAFWSVGPCLFASVWKQ